VEWWLHFPDGGEFLVRLLIFSFSSLGIASVTSFAHLSIVFKIVKIQVAKSPEISISKLWADFFEALQC
jgi:hypothetical protein